MDVYGLNPQNETGNYFRNNVWHWHPLWDFCCDIDPSLVNKVPLAHSNDGDGLKDCEECLNLANKIDNSINNGYAEFYIQQREIEIKNKPDLVCHICDGTGQRPDGLYGIEWKQDGCNACNGSGYVKDPSSHYHLNLENIKEFSSFLKNCGGFQIF